MKRMLLALAAAVILAAPSAVQAQAPPQPPAGAPGPQYQSLGLSADQLRRVQALHAQFGPKLGELERSLRDKRRALEDLYKDFALDMDQARRLNAQINDIQKDILAQHLRLQVELRKILTAEQFGRLKESIERRTPRGFRSRPRGGDRPEGKP
ncbi:MAG TPA: periplasmic heavy metal sensor [Armatimonadota bacterium]|jgi:Spy/CpxP family protein refolding chaperone